MISLPPPNLPDLQIRLPLSNYVIIPSNSLSTPPVTHHLLALILYTFFPLHTPYAPLLLYHTPIPKNHTSNPPLHNLEYHNPTPLLTFEFMITET